MPLVIRKGMLVAVIQLVCCSALSAASPATRKEFAHTVAPFLAKHCSGCHGDELAEAKVRFDRVQPATAATDDRQLWASALERLTLGTMPPEDEPRPDREELENVIHWIRQTLG